MIRIAVAVALAERQEVIELEMPAGASVADALAAARLPERFPGVDFSRMRTGIWSRAVDPSARLRDGDRVELYRELAADPKEMRRKRVKPRSSSRSRNGP